MDGKCFDPGRRRKQEANQPTVNIFLHRPGNYLIAVEPAASRPRGRMYTRHFTYVFEEKREVDEVPVAVIRGAHSDGIQVRVAITAS